LSPLYPLSLHDALPICDFAFGAEYREIRLQPTDRKSAVDGDQDGKIIEIPDCVVHVIRTSCLRRAEEHVTEHACGIERDECKNRSEEHTSELQSPDHLV